MSFFIYITFQVVIVNLVSLSDSSRVSRWATLCSTTPPA